MAGNKGPAGEGPPPAGRVADLAAEMSYRAMVGHFLRDLLVAGKLHRPVCGGMTPAANLSPTRPTTPAHPMGKGWGEGWRFTGT